MPPTGDYSGNRSKRLRTENTRMMGSVGTNSGDDLPRRSKSTSTRKCRLPKKYLDDEWGTVCPVSVPRRLRSSAMKKRMNDGDGNRLPGSDGLMKSKLQRKQVEPEGCVARAIRDHASKDEVEVAEALFALSGGLGGKSSALTKDEDAAGRREDDLETDNHRTDSVLETVKPPSEKLACSKPAVNLHLTAFVSEKQQAICDSLSGAWTQIRKTRSKSGALEKGQACNHQDTPLTPNADGNTKTEKNGSSSKRNSSSAVSFKSPITKFPARIGITSGTATPALKPDDTAKTGAPFFAYSKNSWRRCCTHAYICHYVKANQEKDVNNKKIMQSSTMNGVPNQRDQDRADTVQSGTRNSPISVSSPAKNATEVEDANTSSAKNAPEVENAILLHKMLVKDQQQISQRSLELLHKHAGVGHPMNKAGNSLQTKNQVYPSFPGNQNLSSSGHCPIAPGLQVQLPPYFASRSYVPFTDVNALTLQQFEQQNGNRLVPLWMANFDPSLQTVPPLFHPGQAPFQHSLLSPEVRGYTPTLQQQQQQQQQQQVSSNAKGPYHHLPSGYDANAGRARPDKLMLHHCR